MDVLSLTADLKYLGIFVLVLILPNVLLKLKIPAGISALFIGVTFGYYSPEIQDDQLIRFLAQIGITSLFVFSGLEVDFGELKRNGSYLTKFVLQSVFMLGIIILGLHDFMELDYQTSTLLALGIFTPSTGFILNSLHSLNLGEGQEYWVKSKAISKELISIIIMFFALQSGNLKQMIISTVIFIVLITILPRVFKLFFKYISPLSPNLEVPFLVALSLAAGIISKELGTYYLVGAFIVGLVGASFKKEIFKENEKQIFSSLSTFFTVFLPFYFFFAGLKLSFSGFNLKALQLGFIFLVIFIPLRFMLSNTSMRHFLKDFKEQRFHISLSLMPTLIFGLVIAGELKQRHFVSSDIIYALIFYTLISSLIPTIHFAFEKTRRRN